MLFLSKVTHEKFFRQSCSLLSLKSYICGYWPLYFFLIIFYIGQYLFIDFLDFIWIPLHNVLASLLKKLNDLMIFECKHNIRDIKELFIAKLGFPFISFKMARSNIIWASVHQNILQLTLKSHSKLLSITDGVKFSPLQNVAFKILNLRRRYLEF